MNTPYYNYGAFGNCNWDAIFNDYYYQMAAKYPNLNFRGSYQTDNVTTPTEYTPQNNSVTNSGSIPVDYATVQPDNSNASLWAIGAIGAATIIGGFALKGKGAKLFGRFFKSGTKKASESVQTALKNIRAVKCPDGEIRLNVPGKTVTRTGKEISTLVREYGIQNAVSTERMAYNPQVSVLEKIIYNTPGEHFAVYTKDGVITKIIDKDGNEVLKRFAEAKEGHADVTIYEKMQNAITELAKAEKDIDKKALIDVSKFEYTNQFGDDILKLSKTKIDAKPELSQFTTLERFKPDAEAVKSYTPSSKEEVFAKGLFDKKGVLADGLGVTKCHQDINGTICYFENGNLVRIKQGENIYESSSFGFKNFVDSNEKDINNFKKLVFKDKKKDKIPTNAIIETV